MTKPLEPEIKAMRAINRALSELPEESQVQRVLEWTVARAASKTWIRLPRLKWIFGAGQEDDLVTPAAGTPTGEGLRLCPVSLAVANEHVMAWHRHNDPVIQCVFRVGVCDSGGVLRAVAIAESPKGRGNMDGDTIEITRVASDGTKNACSMLYGACARASFALGFRRVITYTQASESGSSLRAAGYRVLAQRPARAGWHTVSRPRDNTRYESVPRQLLGSGRVTAGSPTPRDDAT